MTTAEKKMFIPDWLKTKPWTCRIRVCKPDRMIDTRKIEVQLPNHKTKIIYEFTLACRDCGRQVKKYSWEPDENG